MSYDSTETEAIPVIPTVETPEHDVPDDVFKVEHYGIPATERVYAVSAPTLVLKRVDAGWESEDGLFKYPTTLHMFADWPDGVREIPDASPFEKAFAYWTADRTIPPSVHDVFQNDWDMARILIEELRAGNVLPAPIATN